MKTFKKVFAITTAILMISSSSAYADSEAFSTYDDLHRDTGTSLNLNYQKDDVIRPLWDGYTYSVQSQTQRRYEDWSLVHTNADDVADSVTYGVAITKSASISVGAEEEFNGLVAKAKFNANVSFGINTTTTVNITWNLPKGKWRLSAGAMFNKVTGYKEYRINGQIISKEAITADYTFDRYSDQVKQ